MTQEKSIDSLPRAETVLAGASSCADKRPGTSLTYFLILIAAAALPYLNTLRNDFVYDDLDQVLRNPYIRNFHHLREIFTSSAWSFMGDFRGTTNYYRPMMSLGYLLCYQVFGPRAWGFHLANILLNVGVVILVFLVTLRMFASRPIALLTACIFALHPVHSEAVDWIAAVTELELAFFYLLTFWLFLKSARPDGRCSIPAQIAIVGSFVLTLLSKEQALTLPVLATLYEHFFRDDRSETTAAQKVTRYGALWLLTPAYLAMRARFLGGLAPQVSGLVLGTRNLIISGLALVGRHFWKLLWPAKLCAYYVFPSNVGILRPWAWGGAAALALCVVVFAALWKAERQAAFGVVWLLVGLAPVLNVRWLTSNPFAERYLYLSSLGFCWIAGWAGIRLWQVLSARGRIWQLAAVVAAGIVVIAAAVRIVIRNRNWRNNLTFYTSTLAVSPDAYYIHNNLGTVYWAMGNIAGARKEWTIAYRLTPRNEYVLHNLGLLAFTEKQYAQAEDFYLRALNVQPAYSDAHLDLGKAYEATGQFDDAEAQLAAAVRLSPLSVRAHNSLSEFYLDRRRLPESEAEARRSVEAEPNVQGYWDLGLAEWLQGNRAGTEQAFLAAERLAPATSRAHFMLGLFYMDSGRNADALREYRAGLKYDPTNAEALANAQKLQFLAIP